MNKEQKYELIPLKKSHKFYDTGVNYQIRALKDFADIKKGDLGGYVNNEYNLSQKGECWLYGNAKIYSNAMMFNNAEMHDNTILYGNAKMFDNARIFDNAKMHDNARIFDNAIMFGNAKIFDNAKMHDNTEMHDNAIMRNNAEMRNNAKMFDNAKMLNNAIMFDNAKMFGNAKMLNNATLYTTLYGTLFSSIALKQQKDIKVISNVGSENGILTLVRFNNVIYANRGCFYGTLEELIGKAKEEDNKHYKNIKQIAKLLFEED